MCIAMTKKFLYLGLLGALFFIAAVNSASAAAENVWTYTTNQGLTAYGPYKSTAVTNSGVFSLALRTYSFSPSSLVSGIEVHMRNLNNTAGWKQYIPTVVAFQNSSPVITADETGVYVVVKKLSNFTGSNPAKGVISITKLSPVDGSIIAIREYPASLYAPVWAVTVDGQGLYVVTNQYTSGSPHLSIGGQGQCINAFNLSGSRWLVQKWDKSLLAPTPIWQYTSQESGGTHGDYYVNSVAMNTNSIFVGGAKMNLSCTSIAYQARLESINKNTGTRNWLRLDPVGSGRINTITADDSSLFIATQRPEIYPWTSRLEERNLQDGTLVWSKLFPSLITSVLLNKNYTLILGYLSPSAYWGGNDEIYLQNVNSTNGVQIGTLTVNTLVRMYDYLNPIFDNDNVLSDTIKLDSSGAIYVAGSSGIVTDLFNVSQLSTTLKKYNAFAAVNGPPTTPVITGPTTGSINTAYTFSAVASDPENDSIRYGFDWNRDNIVDTWAPTSGHVVSGQSQSTSRLWNAVGNQQFQVLSEDSFGSKSAWAQYATLVSVTPRLLICPSTLSIGVGTVSSLEARYWANQTTVPVCATTGYTNVTNSATWISTVPSRASVTNSGARGVVTGVSSGNTLVSATYNSLVSTVPVNVAAATTPTFMYVNIIPKFTLVRSRTVVDLRVAITANVNLICTIKGIEGSPAIFTHIGSAVEKNYNQFKTRPMQSVLQVSLNCYNSLNPAETAEDVVRIEVIPTMQEV